MPILPPSDSPPRPPLDPLLVPEPEPATAITVADPPCEDVVSRLSPGIVMAVSASVAMGTLTAA
jgi:hypothetical protein